MKRLMCFILILMLMLGLCACGGEAPQPEATEAASADMVTYTVHVEDETGAPLSGVMVQICKDVCIPGMTDAAGDAVFTVAEDDYKVSILALPDGYTYSTQEMEFHFEDGAEKITLVLKTV